MVELTLTIDTTTALATITSPDATPWSASVTTHPNAAGSMKIAMKWDAALTSLF